MREQNAVEAARKAYEAALQNAEGWLDPSELDMARAVFEDCKAVYDSRIQRGDAVMSDGRMYGITAMLADAGVTYIAALLAENADLRQRLELHDRPY